jgi:hypothetical protein
VLFTKPRQNPTQTFEQLTQLMNVLEENQTIAAYANIRNAIFVEYFDNRLYLIELFMDYVT